MFSKIKKHGIEKCLSVACMGLFSMQCLKSGNELLLSGETLSQGDTASITIPPISGDLRLVSLQLWDGTKSKWESQTVQHAGNNLMWKVPYRTGRFFRLRLIDESTGKVYGQSRSYFGILSSKSSSMIPTHDSCRTIIDGQRGQIVVINNSLTLHQVAAVLNCSESAVLSIYSYRGELIAAEKVTTDKPFVRSQIGSVPSGVYLFQLACGKSITTGIVHLTD